MRGAMDNRRGFLYAFFFLLFSLLHFLLLASCYVLAFGAAFDNFSHPSNPDPREAIFSTILFVLVLPFSVFPSNWFGEELMLLSIPLWGFVFTYVVMNWPIAGRSVARVGPKGSPGATEAPSHGTAAPNQDPVPPSE